ncbi:MAG TPA: UvrD-helicase domain-containing protein [Streptosporangiaceae bacterium]|nr:UvrD-helicase domain-containing protein [Streptosporangiaceae bacterium]
MLTSTGFEPTREQRAVVEACAAGADLVIEAGAGTGKTSVLRMASAAMTGRRGVYLAFTRATADSARLSFGPDVQCVTAHALAYRAVGWRYADRLRGRAARMPAWAVARQLGICEPLRLGRDLITTPAHQARIVLGTVERFCFSGDERIGGAHVPPVNGVDPASFAELTWRIVPWAERAWHDIRAVNGTLPFRHDHYLKLWQLTRPRIGADYLMFDEAQDANPVIVAVVQDQSGLQKVAVGDSCQAIYGWRGAVDALATWPASTRLQLSCSFRFGSAVAHEANNWLEVLGAPFLLSGSPRIASAVGPVDAPDAIVCRTNAEALVQARLALAAGRRVALAGGGTEVRQLAVAALELQDTGRTAHPELAAFRSWKAVRDFVRTDTAGADLAASVRLIDKHGPAEVLAVIGQLSSARRANLVVSTAHRAKGLEWDSVQVAGDFRRVLSGETVTRADAMLAYVAVTRARTGLDQTGLDTRRAPRVAATITKEITMEKAEFDIAFDEDGSPATLLDGDPHVAPYIGGRAQAESGSAIVETDFYGWLAVALDPPGMPPSHPRVVQLGEAWRLISKLGLGDDPGTASIRYQVLAHAAGALIEPVKDEGFASEADALLTLRQHSLVHGRRLYATSTDLFTRSGKSGPYSGRGEASGGSRIVEKDYRNWTRTPAATSAAVDPAMWEHADVFQQAWASVERRGLADGPEQAAARYQALSGFARNLADDFSYRLPSGALVPLLELAVHAEKHAIRLHSTAIARTSGIDYEALCQATWGRSSIAPYGALPVQVAMTAARARSEIPIGGQRPLPASTPGRRALPHRTARDERA